MVLAAHGIIAAIEFTFYLLLLIPTTLNVWHWGVRQHTGWIFMTLYALRKSKPPTIHSRNSNSNPTTTH